MLDTILTLRRTDLPRHTARVFEGVIRTVLSFLLLALTFAMGKAVYVIASRILVGAVDNLQNLLKASIVDSLTLLAVLEVYRTVQMYFTAGRVKVTYTLDTVLVVLLTDVLAFWFAGTSTARILLVVGLILLLVAARALAIRYSPGTGRR